MMEIVVALAIVAILATLAVPSMVGSIVRDQIVKAVPLADVAKRPIEAMWQSVQAFPENNAAAGLPPAHKIVGNYVSAVAIENGVIQITFGNSAHSTIAGKVLSLRPAVVDDAPVVPIAWVCAFAPVPKEMSVKGVNATTVPNNLLPFNCK
ncbi:MAG: pilin [Burkholderiales bacterium]